MRSSAGGSGASPAARTRLARVASVMEEDRDILAVPTPRNMVMGAGFQASTAVPINVGLLNLMFTADGE